MYCWHTCWTKVHYDVMTPYSCSPPYISRRFQYVFMAVMTYAPHDHDDTDACCLAEANVPSTASLVATDSNSEPHNSSSSFLPLLARSDKDCKSPPTATGSSSIIASRFVPSAMDMFRIPHSPDGILPEPK
uniref:Uncharacterized protein n=1 Tax=Micrurus spixii TaxID=129469 RepID=A0A2D4M0Q0_9SAUR